MVIDPLIIDFKIAVNVRIDVLDAQTGKVLYTEEYHNLVVKAGRNMVRDFLNGLAPAALSHFAIGTGTTAVNQNDTALQTEVFRDTITKRTPTDGKLQVKYFLASTAANGSSLAEAGILNAASGGTLFARVTHTAIAKTSSVAVVYTWDININAG